MKLPRIDYNAYDYTRWPGCTNVVHRWEKGSQQSEVRMNQFMSPLFDLLKLHHADWTLVTKHGWASGNGPMVIASYIDIYAGDEFLGSVDICTRGSNSDRAYEIGGPRVDRALRRGRWMRTSDTKKAHKIIRDLFVAQSHTEYASTIRSKAHSAIHQVQYARRRDYERLESNLSPKLLNFIETHADTLAPMLSGAGIHTDEIQNWLEARENHRIGQALYDTMRARQGSVVAKFKDRFVVTNTVDSDDPETAVVTESQLTNDQRQKMALLKVFDRQNELLEDVGVVGEDGVFYLLP